MYEEDKNHRNGYSSKNIKTSFDSVENRDLDYYNKLLNLAIAKKRKKNKILDNLMLKLSAKVEIQDDLN